MSYWERFKPPAPPSAETLALAESLGVSDAVEDAEQEATLDYLSDAVAALPQAWPDAMARKPSHRAAVGAPSCGGCWVAPLPDSSLVHLSVSVPPVVAKALLRVVGRFARRWNTDLGVPNLPADVVRQTTSRTFDVQIGAGQIMVTGLLSGAMAGIGAFGVSTPQSKAAFDQLSAGLSDLTAGVATAAAAKAMGPDPAPTPRKRWFQRPWKKAP